MINSTQDANTLAKTIEALNAANSSLGKKSASAVSETQDRFLKLLITQMKNQDPLNPMDNAQVTSQMAQLSTVSGIDKLNTTLKALSDSTTIAQSAGMIGRGVLVPGSTMSLKDGQAMGGLELKLPTDSITVKIQDAAGAHIRTLQLGAQKAGVLPLAWDGITDKGTPAANGTYKFTAEASLSDKKSAIPTLVFGMVNAVIPDAKGAILDVSQAGRVALSEVRQVM